MSNLNPPRPWSCNVKGRDWSTVVYAATRSKARYQYWSNVREAWPDIPIMAIAVHSCGPVDSLRFRRTAKYRGLEFARQGMRVELSDGRVGFVVDSNDSANFVVDCGGTRLHCHPRYKIAYFDESGCVIADFRKEA